MKIKIILLLSFTLSTTLFSQKDKDILFKIDGEPVLVDEFKKIYEINIDLLDNNQENLEGYFNLYVNYKLKVKEAYNLKLDTTKTYKREIKTYRNQLIEPYLLDTTNLYNLVKDAYFRTKHQITASHILVSLPLKAPPKDTLVAYQKIIKYRNEILSGKLFSEVAKTISDDISVKSNGGSLGSFTAFKMVYPFENAAYNTKVGEISMPFRTRFGYHIVKVIALEKSKGELEVAHILITDKSGKGKNKIDNVYDSLQKGVNFESLAKQVSNDSSTASKGGKLPKFGTGKMIKIFEDTAFALIKENELSRPFQTKFGWHIIKLLDKYPVKSFSELKDKLIDKVKSTGIAKLSGSSILNRLKKEYKISVNEKSKEIFKKSNIRIISADSLQGVLVTINDKKIKQINFSHYIKNRNNKSILALFDEFIDQEILTYFKENLIYTEPAYASTLKEYEEGLLIFDLLQKEVWSKSTDSIGLKSFFDKNKKNYTFKELSKNKGEVINDYQTYIEGKWIEKLRVKYSVKIKNKTLKKVFKFYSK